MPKLNYNDCEPNSPASGMRNEICDRCSRWKNPGFFAGVYKERKAHMEEKIIFMSEEYEIEGLFEKNDGEKGVVITHPHPLYGGDMYNYVVEAILRAYKKSGYATLRFNFRGTGKSHGEYGNGIGEQKDVMAAISYLFENTDADIVDLAGYSFGAWVNSKVGCQDGLVQNMVMVSPPAGFMDFQPISPMPCLKLLVIGDRDDIASADLVKDMVPEWNPKARLEVIKGADHFYSGHLGNLQIILDEFAGEEGVRGD